MYTRWRRIFDDSGVSFVVSASAVLVQTAIVASLALGIGREKNGVQGLLDPQFVACAMAAACGSLLVLLLHHRLRRRLSKPVSAATDLARHVAACADYSRRLPETECEAAPLLRAMNEMLAVIERRQRTLIHEKERLQAQVIDQSRRLVELNSELAAAAERVRQADRQRTEFAANISHEIRTPMNGIIGLTALTLESDLAEEQRQNLTMVKTSADTLLTIINDILDFTGADGGRVQPRNEPIDLPILVESTVRAIAERAHEKDLDLSLRIDPSVPARVMADGDRLRRVLLNLADNALRFTERGHIEIQVATHKSKSGVRLRFSVKDTGIGIAPDRQTAIFEPFVQADGSITRQYGGAGLGLAICRRHIEIMGGALGVESSPGRGSEFWFTLPCTLALESQPLAPMPDLREIAVGVLESHGPSREALVALLEQCGATVTAWASADEAARRGFEDKTWDLLLLDFHAEGWWEVTQPGARTLLMARSADACRAREAALQGGVEAVLVKPVLRTELLTALPPAIRKNSPGGERRLNILLAEDNAVNQRVAKRLLEKRGHNVMVAANGLEAVALWRSTPVDLVLMDIQMPVMDGIEAVTRIRQEERELGSHVPVIALTAHSHEDYKDSCMAAGMDGYVCKPINVSELVAAMNSVLPVTPSREAYSLRVM